MDYDDSKIDDDLDKLLQHIKEDQQNSMDAPDSPKDDALGGHGTHEGLDSKNPSSPSRHLLYTTHFPLPQVNMSIISNLSEVRAEHCKKRCSNTILMGRNNLENPYGFMRKSWEN